MENHEIQTVTASGRPAEKRVPTPEVAWAVYLELVTSHATLAMDHARIQAQKDGEPPFNVQKRKEAGFDHLHNVNLGEAASILEFAVDIAHSMVVDAAYHPALVSIPSYALPVTTPNVRARYTHILQDEYTKYLRDWPGWYVDTLGAVDDQITFGFGAMIWPDASSPTPRQIEIKRLRLPSNASVEPHEVDRFAVVDTKPIYEMFDIIRAADEDRDAPEAADWDIPALRDYLVECFKDGTAPSNTPDLGTAPAMTWEIVQENIRLRDPMALSRMYSDAHIIHLYVQETTKEVTHIILPGEKAGQANELYRKEKKYAQMDQALWLLPYRKQPRRVRAQRGLGHRIWAHVHTSNKMMSGIYDSVDLTRSLLLSPTNGTTVNRAPTLRLGGPVALIPRGFEPVQATFAPNLNGIIAVRDMSQRVMSNNTGVLRTRDESIASGAEKKSAAQVYSELDREARFEKSVLVQRYQVWDRWHSEIFSRLRDPKFLFFPFATYDEFIQSMQEQAPGTELGDSPDFVKLPGRIEALTFFLNCVRRGVPVDVMLNPGIVVKTARAVGMGSASMQREALSHLMSTRGTFPGPVKREIEREFLAMTSGSFDHADRFYPYDEAADDPTSYQSKASMENAILDDGNSILVGSDEPHWDHIMIHIAEPTQLIQAIVEDPASVDMAEAAKVVLGRMPHILEHTRMMAADPAMGARVQDIQQWLEKSRPVLNQLARLMEEQQQQEQQALAEAQGRMSAADEVLLEDQRERMRLQLHHDREVAFGMADIESQNAQRSAKTFAGIQAKLIALESQINTTAQKTAADIENLRAITEAKVKTTLDQGAAKVQQVRDGAHRE